MIARLAVAVTVAVTSPAAAQLLPPEVSPATRVRVTTGPHRLAGTVTDVAADRTSFQMDCWHRVGPPCPGPFTAAAIDRLELSRGNHAVEGAAIGAGLALLLSLAYARSANAEVGFTYVLGGFSLVTVPIGALLGAGSLRWQVVYRRAP